MKMRRWEHHYTSLRSRDADVGVNPPEVSAQLQYTLSMRKAEEMDTEISRAGTGTALDREKVAVHDLLLTALDAETHTLWYHAFIHVMVLDANDNAPLFTHRIQSECSREHSRWHSVAHTNCYGSR